MKLKRILMLKNKQGFVILTYILELKIILLLYYSVDLGLIEIFSTNSLNSHETTGLST